MLTALWGSLRREGQALKPEWERQEVIQSFQAVLDSPRGDTPARPGRYRGCDPAFPRATLRC